MTYFQGRPDAIEQPVRGFDQPSSGVKLVGLPISMRTETPCMVM